MFSVNRLRIGILTAKFDAFGNKMKKSGGSRYFTYRDFANRVIVVAVEIKFKIRV